MSPPQIVHLLRSQVIPVLDSPSRTGIIVARPVMNAADMPDGVTLSRRRITDKRVAIRNKRKHGNQRNFIAEWPKANLQEIVLPKLAYIVSGTADYLLSTYCVHCGPGNFIVMPPHVPHQCKGPFLQGAQLQKGSCVLLHAYAHQHGVLFWYSQSLNNQHINEMNDNYLISNISATQILNLLAVEAANEASHFEYVGRGLLGAFFAIIAREIEAGNYLHPGPKENVSSPQRITASFADQVREYVESHCGKVLRVEDAATHMYMSSSQFSRRMRQETGMSFIELLTRVRIERAQRMLRETDLTFVAIAGYLSYKSSTQFHHLFVRHTGCSPMEYRKKSRK